MDDVMEKLFSSTWCEVLKMFVRFFRIKQMKAWK